MVSLRQGASATGAAAGDILSPEDGLRSTPASSAAVAFTSHTATPEEIVLSPALLAAIRAWKSGIQTQSSLRPAAAILSLHPDVQDVRSRCMAPPRHRHDGQRPHKRTAPGEARIVAKDTSQNVTRQTTRTRVRGTRGECLDAAPSSGGKGKGKGGDSPLDSQRNFTLNGATTYTMPAGAYYFNDMDLTGQSVLNLSGETVIYLTGDLKLELIEVELPTRTTLVQ